MEIKDFKKNKLFNRRILILGIFKISLVTSLISRLGYLQLFKNKEYSIRSDRNRIKLITQPAPRGDIYDRNKISLTKNSTNYKLVLYPRSQKRSISMIDKIRDILQLDDDKYNELVKKIKKNNNHSSITLLENIRWDDLSRLEVNKYKLQDIAIDVGISRNYVFPYQNAHITGYVSFPTEEEINNSKNTIYKHPDFRIGKNGIEKQSDANLRGKFGVKYIEVNAYNIPIRTLSHTKSTKGQQVDLTIDSDLQNYSYNLLKGKNASMILMDINSGEILSYISTPAFDPNLFSKGINDQDWQKLIRDPNNPLNNKPISALYAPASTFKLMAALAALEENFDPKEKINCTGSFRLGNRKFNCWKKEGHGPLDLEDAIKHSCNVYFYQIAKKFGFERTANIAKKFGYGQKFTLDIGNSVAGIVPTKNWKKTRFNKSWVGGDDINSIIGQGYVLANPLQIAMATARIANNGKQILPTITKDSDIIRKNLQLPEFTIASKENLVIIKNAMSKVVNEVGGTSYYQRIRDERFKMAGKTGTSQTISNISDKNNNNNINKDHAIFTAFAPFNKPKFAISVIIENVGFGATHAAPIARDILLKAQKKYS